MDEMTVERCRQGDDCLREDGHCRRINETEHDLFSHHVEFRHEVTFCTLIAWSEANDIPLCFIASGPTILGFKTENDALAFKMRWV